MSRAAQSTGAGTAAPGLRQRMADLHTWVGLLLGWVLYAMFLTGSVSFFKEELSQWMRPELPQQRSVPDAAQVATRIGAELARIAPGAPQWSARLPDARSPVVNVFWINPSPQGPAGKGRPSYGEGNFDPHSGQQLQARATLGGDFFYHFHYQFHYLPALWGRWLAGLAGMFMLVAIISGVITHKKIFTDFFTFRWGKGQRSWLDAHNALSVFGLPFHLMITYTGLITLMAMYMPWGEQAAIRAAALERQQLTAQLNAFIPAGKPVGEAAPLAPLDAMVRQAQARWGQDGVGRITVTQGGDAAARVAVARADASRVSMSPQYLLFEGRSGKLLEAHDQVGMAAETRGVLHALHIGRFADTATRWLYFIVSLAGTTMVGSGLVMWTVKRRTRLPDPQRPHFGFRCVERLNITAIAGLSVAMSAFLWANRLLPTGLAGRAGWEIHVFFIAWGAMLLHAMLRPARRAWLEQLWLAAGLLAALPLVSAFTSDRPLWASLATGDRVFVGMELGFVAFAALHAALALRTMRHQPARPARRSPTTPRLQEEGT